MTTSAHLVMRARDKGLMIATAESCTGGMLAAEITEAPGASDIFDRGLVAYSNAAKIQLLGVDGATLKKFGAVSEETATEMAEGILAQSEADLAISVTGVAGPGESGNKPEGRVCFALARKGAETEAQTMEFGALGRGNVRRASTDHAMEMLGQAVD